MRPPVCAVCRKRFDPSRSRPIGSAGLVRFADYRPLPDGMTGHPAGLEWFCRRHFRAAKALQERSLREALSALERRRWRGALWWVIGGVLVLLAGALTCSLSGRALDASLVAAEPERAGKPDPVGGGNS